MKGFNTGEREFSRICMHFKFNFAHAKTLQCLAILKIIDFTPLYEIPV